MKRRNTQYAIRNTLCLLAVLLLSGCVVRTYKVTKDRTDQDLVSGNRGYLKGEARRGEEAKARKTTRVTQVIEVELHSPIKFEKTPKAKPVEQTQEQAEEEEVMGNRGYITQSITPEIAQTTSVNLEKYTVQKGDTLQKISQKFYGTTKKWTRIYDANKDTIKGPNKIYPGQVINIPTEGLKEPAENLK